MVSITKTQIKYSLSIPSKKFRLIKQSNELLIKTLNKIKVLVKGDGGVLQLILKSIGNENLLALVTVYPIVVTMIVFDWSIQLFLEILYLGLGYVVGLPLLHFIILVFSEINF